VSVGSEAKRRQGKSVYATKKLPDIKVEQQESTILSPLSSLLSPLKRKNYE
jgi:hypothetical protein